jgi:hypothetical protein
MQYFVLHYHHKGVIIKSEKKTITGKDVLYMKFKEFLKNFYASIKESISRFFIVFVCTILFFLTLSFEIVFETNTDEIIVPLCMTYGLVAVLSVLLKTAQEYICNKLRPSIQNILCAVTGVAGFLLIKFNYESLYTVMAYTGIIIALVCFIFFILMRDENRDLAFPRVVTSWVFTSAICSVLSGGLSTCIAAFQTLVFTWSNSYKLYLIVNLFVWIVGFINIFLSFVPKKDIPLPQSKILRTFILFAGLPLYILLIFILLVYLAKIVVTWNMPIGEINWFASFASLFFIFFLLSVMQYTEKIAKLYVKYGGYFLAPVLIMQAIAVFERINAYGLTTPRTVSLVLIIISILFIAGSIIVPKHLNKIALISGIIVLLVTITPFNVIDMPIASQTKILETTLIKNNMLKKGTVIPNAKVGKKDAEKIISAYEYLKYNAKKVPEFIPDSKHNISEIFGFTKKSDYDRYGNSSIYCRFHTKDLVDISEYNKMISGLDNNDIIKIEHNDKQYEIDLKQVAKSLYVKYGNEKSEVDIYIVNDNIALYFTNFSFSIADEEPTNCYFSGYVLIKE